MISQFHASLDNIVVDLLDFKATPFSDPKSCKLFHSASNLGIGQDFAIGPWWTNFRYFGLL